MGTSSMSAMVTLRERKTQYGLVVNLPNDHTAATVNAAIVTAFAALPPHLKKTLTWDQGHEMAQHARFTVDTGVQVYFCDPKSPWQRGTNENTNRLLRQYLPKKSNLRDRSQAELDAIAERLNGRPRQTLGFRSPSQALDEALR